MLDASINLFFRNLKPLIVVAATFAVPLAVITQVLEVIAFTEVQHGTFYEFGDSLRVIDETRMIVLSGVIPSLLALLGSLLIVGAAFPALSEAYIGRRPDARAALGLAIRRLGPLLWVGVLVTLGITAGAIVSLGLLGIWLAVAWAVAVPVVMIEDARGTKALGRSFGLVHNRWWRTFGALLAGMVLIALISVVPTLSSFLFEGLASTSFFLYLASLNALAAVVTILLTPLYAALVAVIYYDLRVSKEGFDVQLLTAGLESGTMPAPVAEPARSTVPPPPPSEHIEGAPAQSQNPDPEPWVHPWDR